MASSMHTAIKVLLLAFIPLCLGRPSFLDGADETSDLADQDAGRRLYLPVEVPIDSLLSAFRAHPQLPSLAKLSTKSGQDLLSPLLVKGDDDVDVRAVKRKMFWQPLGYLPASVRAHNSPTGSAGTETQGSGSNVFRYG